MGCEPADSFACFTDAQWWAFWFSAIASFGTLAAVLVAVFDSVRSGVRARKATRRADYADAAVIAYEQLQAQRAASDRDALRKRLEADLAVKTQYLRVANDYRDTLRVQTLEAELAELRAELNRLGGD